MTPERWRRVRELFDQAADLPAADRDGFLHRQCGTDRELEAEVRSLLESSVSAGEFLEAPAVELVTGWTAVAPPSRIGPWEILRELGHGGMGTVYLGTRSDEGFRLNAAVKLVRRGMDTDFILRRFRTEREILAGLDHPHIARLLDGGSTPDGRPYFAMEYVEGRHLLEDCGARGLGVRDRVRLFLDVCDAVAYAHRHLVVHRDLKPSNILVTPDGSPKLLDFGLAKLLAPTGGPADRTETAMRLLTPDYASPEQVSGARITTATDIYSLGVVLYELVTGRRPYRGSGRSPESLARAVCEEEPERPGLGTDLDNVILMTLRKEPERRYESVGALADDLRRFLDGRPVLARRDTLIYRVSRFVARHKAGTAAAVLGILALAAALAAAVWQARVARAERAEAEQRFADVRRLASSFLFEFHDAIRDLPGSTAARELVVRSALEYLEKLSSRKGSDDELHRELAAAYERVAKVQGGLFESHMGDTRGAQQSLLKALAIREALATATPANGTDVRALAETELQLAQVLLVAHDSAGALRRARRASGILEDVSRAHPADRSLQAGLARGRRYVGVAMLSTGDVDGAVDALRSSVATFEVLAAAEPSSPGYRRELGFALQQLIFALVGTGQVDLARESYAKAVAIQQAFADSEPGNFALRREIAYTHSSMGDFLDRSGDRKGSLACHHRAIPILEGLVAADPRNADARLLLAETLNSSGYLLNLEGERAAAERYLLSSRRFFEQLTAEDPGNVRAELGMARMYESLAAIAATSGERRLWLEKSRGVYRDLQSRDLLDRVTATELDAVSSKLAALAPVGASGP